MPTVLVVGASSGIGLELVKQLAARGEKVYATVRSKQASGSGVDEISKVAGDVTIIEGIDITKDNVGETLKASVLAGVSLDVIIHNAGSINANRDSDVKGMEFFGEQKLENISMDTMRGAFEVNTLGPLRVQQALTPQMQSPGGKVAVISTGMGSIGDNGSGGLYAYRTSKAAVNMVTKSLSCDLKPKEIAVVAIAPGMVVTQFAGGPEMMAGMGAMPVDHSVKGVITVVDELNMDNTGKFMCVKKDDTPPTEYQW